MRILPLLSVALAVTAFSGCFGHTDETLAGDTQVVLRYEVRDAEGNVLAPAATTTPFILGTGGSGLGAGFEESLAGLAENETFERTIEPQPGGTVHRVDSMLESEPQDRVFTVREISEGTGIPEEDLQVGFVIPDAGVGSGLEIVARDNGNATLRYVIRDDQDGRQVEVVDAFGVNVHYWLEDGELRIQMHPIEGALLQLPVRSPEGRPVNPFGVPPGLYRMEGMEGDEILMRGGTPAQVVMEPITVSGRVVDREDVPRPVGTATDGHFGSRLSPVRQD